MEGTAVAGTVTMLFTDIEGSTVLLQALGESYGDLVRDHHRLLRAVAAERGGQLVDTQGDAFFFAFPTAKSGLLAGIDGQRQIAAHAWPGGVQVRVRMGMHTGEPALGAEGYMGIDVVKAARICSAAHGGQLVVSESTHALAGADPPEGVGFRDMGEHVLKGIDRPQRLYQVEAADLPERFPALRSDAPEPASVAGIEGRADALGDRISAAVMSQVETSILRSLDAEAEDDDERPRPAGALMKLSAVGLATLLLFVVVIAASIWLIKTVI